MFGKTTELTPLEARKQLLLVESELNRVQMVNELRELRTGLHQLKNHVNAVGDIAASAAKLVETFSKIRGAFTHEENNSEKKSWLGSLFKGAQTCASMWSAFRSGPK